MNSRKKGILFAGMILAAASTFGAYAQTAGTESRQTENFENQVTAGTGLSNYTPSEHPGATQSANTESAQDEAFENQLSAGTVANYTASEHSGVATTQSPKTESAQEEAFENQLSAGTVSSYTASEHSGTNR
jgi:hypothetical protein